MRHHPFHRRALPAACMVLLAALAQGAAHAAPDPVTPAPQATQPRQFALPEIVAPVNSALGAPVQREQLEAQRGGTDTVNNNMQLDGSVHDNVAHNVVTGSNAIDAGSFANMSGIPTVIQNSGANVLIQNATIINLQLK
jgi:hypothetical protein